MQALPIIGAVVGGVGGVVQATSSASASRFQAKVAQNNAIIAKNNSDRVLQETAINTRDQDTAAAGELGDLLANMGASGFAQGTGSQALRRSTGEILAGRDRTYSAAAGRSQSDAYLQQSQDFKTESNGHKSAARNAMLSGFLDVASSAISGAGRVNQRKAQSLSLGLVR